MQNWLEQHCHCGAGLLRHMQSVHLHLAVMVMPRKCTMQSPLPSQHIHTFCILYLCPSRCVPWV